MDEPIAITGTGAVTAQGLGVAATWEGVLAGRDVLTQWAGVPTEHPLYRLRVAVSPELPVPSDLRRSFWDALSRTQQLACVAADEAILQAGLPRQICRSGFAKPVGLFVATTVCGMDLNERFFAAYRNDRLSADPRLMRRIQPNEVGELLRRRHRIGSPALQSVCLTTCVGSAMQITSACDAIALGECDIALVGGAEALCRVVLSGFHALKVVAPEGCRPFDENRPGMTVGEGAGMLVLERMSHAQARGANILAAVSGTGVSCDAYHVTAPLPSGEQASRAITDALARAGLSRADIHYVNAHGTGTRENDATEAKTLASFFGTEGPPVSSTKRSTGHTFGAAGVLEAILCVQAIRNSIVPVNAGSVAPDPAVAIAIQQGESRKCNMRHALSVNFAFGGNNTAIVLSASGPGPSAEREAA